MSEVEDRLTKCFQTVFPDLPEAEIRKARQESITAWDSVAGITLLNVIEEEFQIQVDLELLAELDSFEHICDYLTRLVNAA